MGYTGEYLKEQKLDPAVYINGKASKAVAYDKMRGYNGDNKLIQYSVFDKIPFEMTLCYGKGQGADHVDTVERKRAANIGAITNAVPYGTHRYKGYGLMLFYPESAKKELCPDSVTLNMVMSYNSDSPSETYRKMSEILKTSKRSTSNLFNIDEEVQGSRALMLILKIFSYGFICLISLIAIANVFNTISTNILLRRREFAMLRSVGMTDKGFRRMMNLECILYGCKGLLFGLIVAMGVTYLIYQALSNEFAFAFYIPWYSIAIAAGSVFIVVFATMLYAMGKIRKDNVVETLKQENY